MHESGLAVEEHRPGMRTIGIHDPDVVLPLPVRYERDAAPIRRVHRMEVERLSAVRGDRCGFATRCRQSIQLTEQVEYDPLAVGGNVERDTGALIGGKVDHADFPLGRHKCHRGVYVLSTLFGATPSGASECGKR